MLKKDNKVKRAIAKAERLLPGVPAPDGQQDSRWHAIIDIGEYIQDYPDEIWSFIEKWGKHPSEDVRSAIACCLLEHLLEYHFKKYFPLVKAKCKQSKRFAFTFCMCGEFGQTEEKNNLKAFLALKKHFRMPI